MTFQSRLLPLSVPFILHSTDPGSFASRNSETLHAQELGLMARVLTWLARAPIEAKRQKELFYFIFFHVLFDFVPWASRHRCPSTNQAVSGANRHVAPWRSGRERGAPTQSPLWPWQWATVEVSLSDLKHRQGYALEDESDEERES